MRPGRLDDLAGLLELWRGEVRTGRRDSVLGDAAMRRVLAGFDWESRCRVVENGPAGLDGAVLVSHRASPQGTVATVEVSAAHDRLELLHDLTRWGLALSRAAGAISAQVWRGRGAEDGLGGLGLELVRPWWRMDRSLANEPSEPSPVAGYELRDASQVPPATWSEVHNRAFADHWRFSPRTDGELVAGRPPSLSILAVAMPGGSPAALTLSQVEVYSADLRPQPVGIVSSVGTDPDHRRRGLATWLVAEALSRLHRAGAHHASLYVDGRSPMRAFDAYRKLGFELAFETGVWEATFR